ncbi:MAG: hypothetical protein Q8P28_04450 [Deltaproteobacteria bacterium]|nr:hypothetical protein [Deltaproteobacteria bacterium]
MIKRIVDYLGNPDNAGRLKKLLYITLAVIVAADFLVPREHAAFFWDDIPGWSAVYGFISCVLIIVVSKFLGHRGLMKKEDYYD